MASDSPGIGLKPDNNGIVPIVIGTRDFHISDWIALSR